MSAFQPSSPKGAYIIYERPLIVLYFVIRYTFSENSKPMDVEGIGYCNDDYDYRYRTYWHEYGNLPHFIRRYEDILKGRYHSRKEHCINNTRQYVAIVHFHIAPSANDLINKIVKTPRVTYADILSNIGILATPHCNLQINNP